MKLLVPTPSIGTAKDLTDARTLRRRLIVASLAGTVLAGAPWRAGAQARAPTPRQTAGPFYPRDFPVDDDSDLVTLSGRSGVAKGDILLLAGTVSDTSGTPRERVRVEIWQCNAFGRYHHPSDASGAALDPNFQGWGKFVTSADGAYRFRTIKPVPYPGRTPHIHFRVSGPGIHELVTQMYVQGEPGNERDGVYRSLDPNARTAVTVRIERASSGNDLAGRFDIVVRSS
jgi:protocatechuate 3,4-dioxygenase beta subunit